MGDAMHMHAFLQTTGMMGELFIHRTEPSFWNSIDFFTHTLPVSVSQPNLFNVTNRDRGAYSHRVFKFSAQLLSILRPDQPKTRSSRRASAHVEVGRAKSELRILSGVSTPDSIAETLARNDSVEFLGDDDGDDGGTDQILVAPISSNAADYVDKLEKWRTIELLYRAIKYFEVFDTVLQECGFFKYNPELTLDRALVIVIFCDFQDRNFQRRSLLSKESTDSRCCLVENAIYEMRTRLAAALARARVKAQAMNLDAMLPLEMRQRAEMGSSMPCIAWCCRSKATMLEVHNNLMQSGFSMKLPERPTVVSELARRNWALMKIMSHTIIPFRTQNTSTASPSRVDATKQNTEVSLPPITKERVKSTRRIIGSQESLQSSQNNRWYSVDFHCVDSFVFDQSSREFLLKMDLLKRGGLVLQDKTSCMAVAAFQMLAPEQGDILVVNDSSGLTSIHLLNVLQASGFGGRIVICNIFVDELAIRQVQSTLEQFSATGVKFVPQSILDANPDDPYWKRVRGILLLAPCSKSAIHNPVDWVVNDGEDLGILAEFSPAYSNEVRSSRLAASIALCRLVLIKVMKFVRVNIIEYISRSTDRAEGADLVQQVASEKQLYSSKKNNHPYRLIPTTLQLSPKEILENLDPTSRFLTFPPSEQMNGCFIATLAREPHEVADAQAILQRALAKGLIQPTESQAKMLKKQRKRKRRKNKKVKS